MLIELAKSVRRSYMSYIEQKNRNSVSISYCINPVKQYKVNLQYCNEKKNVGDLLAPVIYQYMLSLRNISPDMNIQETRHLFSVGSIIDFGMQDATIWGSGLLNEAASQRIAKSKKIGRILDIRSVRGPFTKDILQKNGYKCPEIYGDPAIIMPCIYKPNVEKKYEISCIVHLNGDVNRAKEYESLHFIDLNTSDYRFFIDEISRSKCVVSSSLHGIILAETYGIPAIFLLEDVKDQVMKFYDWYISTDRTNFAIASSLDQALTMQPTPLPDLNELRTKVMSAFPYDMFD